MVEPQWLNDDEREAWLALVALMFKMPGTIERQLVDDEDLSLAEYLVLAMLSEAPDRSHRMSDLAAATFTGQSRLSRIVARLERHDYVRRSANAQDRRVVVAQLTQDGFEKVRSAAPGHVAHVREEIFDSLSAQQVEQIARIARDLTDGVEPPRV